MMQQIASLASFRDTKKTSTTILQSTLFPKQADNHSEL